MVVCAALGLLSALICPAFLEDLILGEDLTRRSCMRSDSIFFKYLMPESNIRMPYVNKISWLDPSIETFSVLLLCLYFNRGTLLLHMLMMVCLRLLVSEMLGMDLFCLLQEGTEHALHRLFDQEKFLRWKYV